LEYSFSWNDSFIGMKVLGTFAPEERKFHGSECSRERKFLERSLPRSESGVRSESSTGAKVLSVDFSLPGTKMQRNEKAWIQPNSHS